MLVTNFLHFVAACGTSPYHHDMSCAQHMDSMRQQQSQAGRGSSSVMDLKAQEAATLEFLKKSGMRVCKKCKGGVVKSGGCDKMKWYVSLRCVAYLLIVYASNVLLLLSCLCSRCGYRFCYQCDAENAQCDCTPRSHGFWDNISGGGDFKNL
jgi:hypothetical protein